MSYQFDQKLKQVEGKLFINGKLVNSKGSHKFQVFNPATEELIGHSVAATQEDVNDAVMAAKEAFDNGPWRKMGGCERGRIIYKFAQLLDKNKEWLAYWECINNGKPLKNCLKQDLMFSSQTYKYFGGMSDKINGNKLNTSNEFFAITIKQPIGVVGQIIPWNYPLLMMSWKCAPALAAGCTIVLKPAQQTPFTALMLGNLINQAGFPPGVINIVTGFGKTGAAVAQHKLINKISFTGSTEVGYIIMRNSHKQNLKPITLQLGGKSANIIFPDVDIQEAVFQSLNVFANAGQNCLAGSRTFVHESIYQKFIETAKSFVQLIRVGDPLAKSTHQGPQVSKQQFDKILSFIKSGIEQGARLITGGKRHGQKGYFIQPTIFADVKDDMKIARQQIFGPVMSIFKWKTEQQVIRRANNLQYGLAAGVVTKDINKILSITPKLEAGSIYVNCYGYIEPSTPFGGVKDSGIGRDLGYQGLQSYLTTKTVIIKSSL